MLQRSTSAATRARARRARQRNGVERILRIEVPTKRLLAAMRAANPQLPEGELSAEAIEAELQAVVEAFIERWLGPAKKPHA
jgi:hypothetical protein